LLGLLGLAWPELAPRLNRCARADTRAADVADRQAMRFAAGMII
jgi:hypothetical protein